MAFGTLVLALAHAANGFVLHARAAPSPRALPPYMSIDSLKVSGSGVDVTEPMRKHAEASLLRAG